MEKCFLNFDFKTSTALQFWVQTVELQKIENGDTNPQTLEARFLQILRKTNFLHLDSG